MRRQPMPDAETQQRQPRSYPPRPMRRNVPARSSHLADASLYAPDNWGHFFRRFLGEDHTQFMRVPHNGTPPGYAQLYHHIIRPRYDNGSAVGLGMAGQINDAPGGIPGKTYADYIRPGTRGDSGRVQSVAAALRASAIALYQGGS